MNQIDKYKSVFFKVGILFSLLVALFVLEWTIPLKHHKSNRLVNVDVDFDMIPLAELTIVKKIPDKPLVKNKLNIISDNESVRTEIDPEDIETEFLFSNPFSVDTLLEGKNTYKALLNFVPPLFPGGIEALKRYLSEAIIYPACAKANDVQGRVYVRFLITNEGNVDSVYVLQSVTPVLDAEAIRVVKSLPPWIPCCLDNQRMDYWCTLPVTFIIK